VRRETQAEGGANARRYQDETEDSMPNKMSPKEDRAEYFFSGHRLLGVLRR
jgi:hypothetical protein